MSVLPCMNHSMHCIVAGVCVDHKLVLAGIVYVHNVHCFPFYSTQHIGISHVFDILLTHYTLYFNWTRALYHLF